VILNKGADITISHSSFNKRCRCTCM